MNTTIYFCVIVSTIFTVLTRGGERTLTDAGILWFTLEYLYGLGTFFLWGPPLRLKPYFSMLFGMMMTLPGIQYQ